MPAYAACLDAPAIGVKTASWNRCSSYSSSSASLLVALDLGCFFCFLTLFVRDVFFFGFVFAKPRLRLLTLGRLIGIGYWSLRPALKRKTTRKGTNLKETNTLKKAKGVGQRVKKHDLIAYRILMDVRMRISSRVSLIGFG